MSITTLKPVRKNRLFFCIHRPATEFKHPAVFRISNNRPSSALPLSFNSSIYADDLILDFSTRSIVSDSASVLREAGEANRKSNNIEGSILWRDTGHFRCRWDFPSRMARRDKSPARVWQGQFLYDACGNGWPAHTRPMARIDGLRKPSF